MDDESGEQMEEDEVKGPLTPASWAMQRKSEQSHDTKERNRTLSVSC